MHLIPVPMRKVRRFLFYASKFCKIVAILYKRMQRIGRHVHGEPHRIIDKCLEWTLILAVGAIHK